MFKILPLLVVVAVLAVKAYDFSNPDYNQYLLDEFYSLNNDVSFSRQRRSAGHDSTEEKNGAPHHFKTGNLICCEGDQIDYERLKQVKMVQKQCAREIRANFSLDRGKKINPFNCEQMLRIKQSIICRSQCLFRTLNLIDENGKINREEIIKVQRKYNVRDIEWKKAAFEGYVDDCLAKAESKQHVNDEECSTAPLDFSSCLMNKYFEGCPADLRIDTPRCNILRKVFRKISNDTIFS